MRRRLPDCEAAWETGLPTESFSREEVQRRLGPTDEPVELLAGGHANLNVRVGTKVLRIYRRDVSALGKEAFLLSLPWRSFRVPRVLDRGDDFLVLEHVPHDGVTDDSHGGASVGRALAEIHAAAHSQAGLLDARGVVTEPWTDFVDALRDHIASLLSQIPGGVSPRAEEILAVFDDHAPLRASGSPVLLHGDFKPSNLHRARTGELLVLDWEFAYSGPALMDVGQLMRWSPSTPFRDAFAERYLESGGLLPPAWQCLAEIFDLANLVDLLARADPGSRRARDVTHRIGETLAHASAI